MSTHSNAQSTIHDQAVSLRETFAFQTIFHRSLNFKTTSNNVGPSLGKTKLLSIKLQLAFMAVKYSRPFLQLWILHWYCVKRYSEYLCKDYRVELLVHRIWIDCRIYFHLHYFYLTLAVSHQGRVIRKKKRFHHHSRFHSLARGKLKWYR